jgi:predicted amidophosphoribosyltransferase
MTDEITQRPAVGQRDMGPMQNAAPEQLIYQQQTQTQGAFGRACPKCGTMNEPEARYCASCGMLLTVGTCPNCGSELDPDADFCEVCHHYVRPDVCSFCGAHFNENDPYCPECGSPRGGIVCPSCHTLNDFSFCKQCGQPLTDEARQMMQQLKQRPDYMELVMVAREYNELQMQLPYNSDSDVKDDEASMELRQRVLRLLAEDQGVPEPEIPKPATKRMTKEQLEDKKRQKLDVLTRLLDQMATPPMPSPAKVRNYAMAQKPMGVRLGWMCNYKHALHSSPCGCAKPQMGGKWVILGHNSKVKDDL